MLRKILPIILITCIAFSANHSAYGQDSNDGWISLFNGKNLDGWTASENKDTFSVRDGIILVKGPRSHLFYTGTVEDANFKDFEFKADIMTKPRANSGMYFHTKYKETGWPGEGFEVQVNNSHTDWRRTGSLYGINDVRDSAAKDNEWFTQHIIVDGRQITVLVNGKPVMQYAVPEEGRRSRKLSSGTFALQGHDPGSMI
ncbi:MAG: 3-keto-disaccharide hydrolase, partial [Planctomycetota bacterium]